MTIRGDSLLVELPVPLEGGGSIPTSPLQIVPVTRRQVQAFIARHHRHNIPSISSVFNIGLEYSGELIGVAMVGVPKSRMLMDGKTLEVTRTCVKDDIKNANSMLYGACVKASAALGWQQLITYTLPSESGVSLKAAGWKQDDGTFGGDVTQWSNSRNHRLAVDMFGNHRIPAGPKLRWRRIIQRAAVTNGERHAD